MLGAIRAAALAAVLLGASILSAFAQPGPGGPGPGPVPLPWQYNNPVLSLPAGVCIAMPTAAGCNVANSIVPSGGVYGGGNSNSALTLQSTYNASPSGDQINLKSSKLEYSTIAGTDILDYGVTASGVLTYNGVYSQNYAGGNSNVFSIHNLTNASANDIMSLVATQSTTSINLEFLNSTTSGSSIIRGRENLTVYTGGSGTHGSAFANPALTVFASGGLYVGTSTTTDPGAHNLQVSGTIGVGTAPTAYPLTLAVASGNYQEFIGSGSYTNPDSPNYLLTQQTVTAFTASGSGVGLGGTGGVSSTTLTMASFTSGAFMPGCTLSGTGVSGSPTLQYNSARGGTGTYTISTAQTIAGSTSLTCTGGSSTFTTPAIAWQTPGLGVAVAIIGRGGLVINPAGIANYTWLLCNESISASLCVDRGPGLRIFGDGALGDLEYIGAISTAGNEVQQIGVRLWGAFASLTIVSAGWEGANVDSSNTNCTSTSTACASGYAVFQPSDANQNGTYGGPGSVWISAHGNVGVGGNVIIFATRSGVNTDTGRWEITSAGALVPFASNTYAIGSASLGITGVFIAGSSSGVTNLAASATASGTATIPAGTVTLATYNGGTANATPANPTATASTTLVNMGIGLTGCSVTPTNSTRLFFSIVGTMASDTSGDGISIRAVYGTGTAPSNGAAPSGTQFGSAAMAYTSPSNNATAPFSQTGIATGLTPGTAVWFDIEAKAVTGGNASVANLRCSALEF